MSSVAPAKNDNDAYTGTENQHDFGKPPQFLLTRSAVTHDDSQLYRNHVDSKFTWNETTENRGVKIAETTYNQEITETGLNNTNDMGYDHANSPFNPENNPLWAYNDVGIIQRVLNMNKDDLQKSSVGWNVAMEGKKFWRNVEIKSSNAEKLFNYKIIRIPCGVLTVSIPINTVIINLSLVIVIHSCCKQRIRNTLSLCLHSWR